LNKFFFKDISCPFFIFYPEKLKKKVQQFTRDFRGRVVYALKANPSKPVLNSLIKFGIDSFDAASLNEIKLIKKIIPNSNVFFMNPVKSRESIKEAYFRYKVRAFSLDNLAEFKKILDETNHAKDLSLFVRLAIPSKFSVVSLEDKFGINKETAPKLINTIKNKKLKVGICFHVGSQCMNPKMYKTAMKMSKDVEKSSGVELDYLNVGGGFPSYYENFKPVNLSDYISFVNENFSKVFCNKSSTVNLLAEPGRSIVSDCMSLVVKVNHRKNNTLFINDGIYGSLNNAGKFNFIYPVKLFGRNDNKSKLVPFSFYGPTCDSEDFVKGPFFLPNSVSEGDYIELFNMGAYSTTMKTDFNGFFEKTKFFIKKNQDWDIEEIT